MMKTKIKKILKTEKLFSKIVMVIFLIMIVLGFTVPGFIGGQDQVHQNTVVEPRLCQSDADCYLTCDDEPIPVLCLQNLCQQNECGYSYFEYDEVNKISFKLDVVVDSGLLEESKIEKLSLNERKNSNDFFVTFNDKQVNLFSPKLSLDLILSKVNLAMNEECLQVDQELYCNNDDKFLSMMVNGEESLEFANYVPQEGDEISISYLPREPLE